MPTTSESQSPRRFGLVVVPLLARQEATYGRLLRLALLGLAPIILLHLSAPLPDQPATGFFVGFVGSFVVAAMAMRRSPKLLGASVALGAIACAVIRFTWASNINVWLGGFGIGAMVVLGLAFLRAGPEERAIARPVLLAGALVPLFLYATVGWTKETERLLPSVFDTFVFAADATLGIDSFRVGRFLDSVPWFVPAAHLVYDYQWPFLMLIWIRQLRDPAPRSDFIATLIVVSALGVTIFYFFPVVGPGPAFADAFPSHPPPIDALRLVPIIAFPERRNCLPSLHNAWAILALWNARRYGWHLRLTTWALVLVTILATLGFGYHYVLDIVVAVPVALFAAATTSRGEAAVKEVRRKALVVAATLTLGWLVTLRYGVTSLVRVPGLTWLLVVSTVAGCLWLERRLAAASDVMAGVGTTEATVRRPLYWQRWRLHALVVLVAWLGVTSLLALTRRALLALGCTEDVQASLLVALLGGVALGAVSGEFLWLSASRRAWAIAGLLAVFAILSLGARSELLLLHDTFMHLARGWDAGGVGVRALTMAIVGLVILPIGVTLGGFFPVFLGSVVARGAQSSQAIGSVGVALGLGAALASWTSAFVMLPQFGGDVPTIVGGAALLVALGLLLVSSRAGQASSTIDASTAVDPVSVTRASSPVAEWRVVLVGSGALLSLTALLSKHLLGVTVGETVYTRTTTLGVMALAGSLGSFLALLFARSSPRRVLATQIAALVVLALTSCAMVGGHSMFAAYFASFGGYSLPQGFAEREFIRAAVASVLVAPAVVAAATVLTTVALVASEAPGTGHLAPGRVVAWVSAGATVGVLLFGSLALPTVGASGAARVVAALAVSFAAWLLVQNDRRHALRAIFTAAVVFTCAACLARDPDVSAFVASEVNFRDSGVQQVAIVGEGVAEGQIAMAHVTAAAPSRRLLLANGLRLGLGSDDGFSVAEYVQLALVHTEGRERAAVLGLGTGEASQTLADIGLRGVDVFEPAPDVVRAARDQGATATNIRVQVADGPSGLALATTPYDIVFIGGVAPWTPRAAPYGNVELYRLAALRLAPGGVVLVALRTDHLEWGDLVSTLVTVRQALPSVFVYARGDDAAVIACAQPCARRRAPGGDPNVANTLESSVVLSDVDVTRLLAALEARGADLLELISTDENARSELGAPRDALLPNRPPGAVLAELRSRATAMLSGGP